MNKEEIKAELRRSACDSSNPYEDISFYAFDKAGEFCWPEKLMCNMTRNTIRTFFLLVAEAM